MQPSRSYFRQHGPRAAAWAGCPRQGPWRLVHATWAHGNGAQDTWPAQGGVMRMAKTSPARRVGRRGEIDPCQVSHRPLESQSPACSSPKRAAGNFRSASSRVRCVSLSFNRPISRKAPYFLEPQGPPTIVCPPPVGLGEKGGCCMMSAEPGSPVH